MRPHSHGFLVPSSMRGTNWNDVKWPYPPRTTLSAQVVAAYERLKLEINRLKKHRRRARLLHRELQCRRVLEGFGAASDAIYSTLRLRPQLIRPLVFLLLTAFAGTDPLLGTFWRQATHSGPSPTRPLEGSSRPQHCQHIRHTRHPQGPDTRLVLETLPGWQGHRHGGARTIGIVLLFLFALGIRNRFRMK